MLKPTCPLCLRRKLTKWHYENYEFWVADCLTCGSPMIVYKFHEAKISPETKQGALNIIRSLFGDKARFRGYSRQIKDHWHEHIIGF